MTETPCGHPIFCAPVPAHTLSLGVGVRTLAPAARFARRALALLGASAAAEAAEPASAYDQIIAPIFQARCVECHGADKQKAKLVLHTWEGAVRGSDAGPIWLAGKPLESVVLQRMQLPLEDDEHMPPKERPQPAAEEIALLARWIERGASRSASMSDLQLSPPLAAAAAELPARLAAIAAAAGAHDVWEFDPAAVARARAPLEAKVAELQRRYPGALSYTSRTAAELHFTAVAFGASFGDADVAALAPLGAQLVSLDVSGTAVTDACASQLEHFANLRLFRASTTALGDGTVVALSALPRLESLVLFNCNVTPPSVTMLQRLPALRKLHLGETAAAAVARDARLPVVGSMIEFPPAPEAPAENGDKKTR